MPTGIIATVDGGFATIDFVDQSLKGPALAEVIDAAGQGVIETITRDGPRRKYRMPVGNADDAGLLDGDEVGAVWSAGADTGKAAATQAADPNVLVATVVVTATAGNWKYTYGGLATAAVAFNVSAANLLAAIVALANVDPGDVTVTSPVAKTYIVTHKKRASISVASDTTTPLTGGTVTVTVPGSTPDDDANWHTPVAEYTSANKYNGQVSNASVLHSRGQVLSGAGGNTGTSFGGDAAAPTNAELITKIKAYEVAHPKSVPAPRETVPAAHVSGALARQTGALGTDPGSHGVGSLDAPADPAVDLEDDEPTPDESWTRAELNDYAADLGIEDADKLPNKGAVLEAIEAKENK